MPLFAAAAGLASITGVAAAVTLIGDDDPTVGSQVVDQGAHPPEQLAASIEAMLAAATGPFDPTATAANGPVGATPSESTVDPVVAAAIADLQSNAVGLPPAP
jgi:hypothetical protein